jgi:ABC-type branched-subunit amino acid transport system ATPase component
MWVRTSLAATGMWAQTHTGRSRHVGADATAGTVMAGADLFPEMTVSQNLVLG